MEKYKYKRYTRVNDRMNGYTVNGKLTLADLIDRLALLEEELVRGNLVFVNEDSEKYFFEKLLKNS